MSYKSIILFACLLIAQNVSATDWIQYVDTRVGTDASRSKTSGLFGKGTEVLGQTLPAVLAPNGMNFWTPQTRDTELKGVCPYYYADSTLQGFRNSHWIVGGCTQDYGSMTIMPLTGKLRCAPAQRASRFSHQEETARPDYYKTNLPDERLSVEMTGTSRCAIFRFTYDGPDKAYFVINPNSDEAEGYIAIDTLNRRLYGYNPVHRIYQGKGEPAGFSGYFVVQFNDPIKEYGCYEGEKTLPDQLSIAKSNGIGCYVAFDIPEGDKLTAKAASSFTSIDSALQNMEAEIPHWDFDKTQRELAENWNEHLGVIEVESDSEENLKKFYGSMYRASFLPHEINDVSGLYPSFSTGSPIQKLPEGESRYYDGYSMWDTYRALHPFLNLIYPAMSGEMMQSLVHKYEQGGWLPIFPCWNSYTSAMIGDHCISALSDAMVKGVKNFDYEKAYEGMRHNAFDHPTEAEYKDGKGRRALTSYLAYGYVPLEDSVPYAYHRKEQVSRTLEYSFDDFALAQAAKLLGKEDDYNELTKRAANYKNVFNPAIGYVDGRHADGTWAGNNPFGFSPHITEGAPCHYAWYVPHDPEGLIEAMGGKEMFVMKLDSMFSEQRYWHGNEPCHQVAYMYGFADQSWKTSREVRRIMDTEYENSPGGLSGNDDAGQMSAWYLFSALGFYPVCPATDRYMISGPTFKSATLHLENGKELKILAPEASDANIYVKSIKRNGKPYTRNYLIHSELMEGGVFEFDMVPHL